MVAQRKLKYSSRFPHLSYDLGYDAQGNCIVTFKGYGVSETYILKDGEYAMIDCSDRGVYDPVVKRHVIETVKLMAKAKFAQTRAA